MKSIPLFVQASSLCMRNEGSVRRQMSRPRGKGREMAPLNSAGNQLVKLNIKKSGMIVCGKAICLQLATSRITHSQAHINTFTSNGTRPITECVFCVCRQKYNTGLPLKVLVNKPKRH